MKKLKSLFPFLLLLICLGAITTSCSYDDIPTGHLARVRNGDGFANEINGPGRVHTWWFQQLYTLETSDQRGEMRLSILCTDKLNFQFSIGLLYAVDQSKQEDVRGLFEEITPLGGGHNITAQQLFNMYIKDVVDQEARKVVSRYSTRAIVDKRTQIIQELVVAITEALKDSVVKVKRVTVNNMDFPKVITDAQIQRAQREVQLDTEKAQQRIRVLQAQNQLKLTELEYQQELVQASMIADSNKLIGGSITAEYLAWWQLKVMSEAAKGPNNWGFIPYTDFVNGESPIAKRLSNDGLVDAALLERLQAAKEAASNPEIDAEPAQ
jgi:hypothetical protein